MSEHNQGTEPNMPPVINEASAPPKFLLWGVVGLFILVILSFLAGFWAFNNILTAGQQARVIGELPFMENFLVRNPTPEGGVLPTIDPNFSGGGNALDLLNQPLVNRTPTASSEVTEEVTAEASQEPTEAAMAITNTPLPSNTPLPTNTPLATNTALPVNQANAATTNQSLLNLPSSHRNTGFQWAQQTWNNCGPATVTTAMTFFGWTQDQEYAKDLLRPNREDKNVSPDELVRFVEEQSQLDAVVRMGGNLQILKALIAAGFPVIVERGIMFEAYDWIGHYQALVAYDDSSGGFFAYDSFLGDGAAGEGIFQSYTDLDTGWRAFNRTFIVLFTPDEASLVQSILGDLWDETRAAEVAAETAQSEARANTNDAFAWFNLGTSLNALGRYQEASNAFDRARSFPDLPWRMLWYQFGIFEAYYQMGRYEDIVSLANTNLTQLTEHEESYYWRARAYAAQNRTSDALVDLRTALRYNPNFEAASIFLDELQ